MILATAELIARWLADATLLRSHGAIEAAATKELAAAELEAFERDRALEALPLSEAAKESGFSAAHLGRLLAESRIPNAGEKGAPRIRRKDLPRKPPTKRSTPAGDPDL